ncbi:MAG: tRNA (adenosine(37)-N6)-dimethylallyltransferase MiaA [Elusimicrobiota bacterium]|nr:tRNA (adenosine(37)-N6)-dimethylallyltransferase MiaA [Elusimicrobiota bacterium]
MIPAVTGPTGAGKTSVAAALAEITNGAIINADSQSVYKYFNIGTSKPPAAMRKTITHYLVDFINPGEQFSAGDFVLGARRAIKKIRKNGKLPIICGGTGLYISALKDGISPIPASSEIRDKIAKMTTAVQLETLKKTDPEMYASIDKRNPRRVARALEIFRITGLPPTKALKKNFIEGIPLKVFFLSMPRTELYRKIDERVEQMLEKGLVREVRRILEKGVAPGASAFSSIGYKEILEHIKGNVSLREASEKIKFRTHLLARKQEIWWRKKRAVKINVLGKNPMAISAEIVKILYNNELSSGEKQEDI